MGWAMGIGSINQDWSLVVKTDALGNVYIAGNIDSEMDFDPGPGTALLSPMTGADMFAAKYASDGTFMWVRLISGDDFRTVRNMNVDAAGRVYVVGQYAGTLDLDPGDGTFPVTSALVADMFITVLDTDGLFVWGTGIGGAGSDNAADVDIDASGNVYITGVFQETVDFDPGSETFSLTSSGNLDIFVLALNSSGSFLWASSMGGPERDESSAISVDSMGNVHTTGKFGGTVDFDPGPDSVTMTGISQIFLSRN